jgi:hypothetical protein
MWAFLQKKTARGHYNSHKQVPYHLLTNDHVQVECDQPKAMQWCPSQSWWSCRRNTTPTRLGTTHSLFPTVWVHSSCYDNKTVERARTSLPNALADVKCSSTAAAMVALFPSWVCGYVSTSLPYWHETKEMDGPMCVHETWKQIYGKHDGQGGRHLYIEYDRYAVKRLYGESEMQGRRCLYSE